ncbi:putative Protein kinase domain containing protein [Blattamonas nauphoetae]|uniref:Protein kinase domain-containing protein n=1 Tax=Blattamonas nauphoetae TaxID=2049346 RepID=A0ABQ9YIK2_9EUKA|nr:putative Protein kinase domain containing protein [Blattamonas nauphoetae]
MCSIAHKANAHFVDDEGSHQRLDLMERWKVALHAELEGGLHLPLIELGRCNDGATNDRVVVFEESETANQHNVLVTKVMERDEMAWKRECPRQTPKPLRLLRRILNLPRSSADTSEADSEESDAVVAQSMAVLNPCSTHTIPLPSASPLTALVVARTGAGGEGSGSEEWLAPLMTPSNFDRLISLFCLLYTLWLILHLTYHSKTDFTKERWKGRIYKDGRKHMLNHNHIRIHLFFCIPVCHTRSFVVLRRSNPVVLSFTFQRSLFIHESSEMTTITDKNDTSSSTGRSDLSSLHSDFSMDCSAFLNWDECRLESEQEIAVVFRSLVVTLKFQPALDASLEAKAIKFLEFVKPKGRQSADAFLSTLASSSDESVSDFVRCIVVLVSSPSQIITTAAMEILNQLIYWCSPQVRLALVRADLFPQLITALNPQSHSFSEAVDIHTNLLSSITRSLRLTTPDCLTQLEIEDGNEEQAVHETVFQQVLTPSGKYICHLCVNRFSIVDGVLCMYFLALLAGVLEISPSHQWTMDFVLNRPVFLSVPSYHEGIHITIYSGTTLPNPLTRRPLLPSPLDVPCSPLPSTSPAPIFPRCPLLTCGLCRLSESLVIVAEENGLMPLQIASDLPSVSLSPLRVGVAGLCMNPETKKEFALKILPTITEIDKKRARREVEQMKRFSHPRIVGFHDSIETEAWHGIIMELGSRNLKDLICEYEERGERIPLDVVVLICNDIVEGLKFMHTHPSGPTAHGDLKPENVLLSVDNRAILCDLGAADEEGVMLSHSAGEIGTYEYNSPERLDDDKMRGTPQSDMWSVGVILHRMVTGRPLTPPFGSNPLNLLTDAFSRECWDQRRLCL